MNEWLNEWIDDSNITEKHVALIMDSKMDLKKSHHGFQMDFNRNNCNKFTTSWYFWLHIILFIKCERKADYSNNENKTLERDGRKKGIDWTTGTTG